MWKRKNKVHASIVVGVIMRVKIAGLKIANAIHAVGLDIYSYVANDSDSEESSEYLFQKSIFSLMNNVSSDLYYVSVTIDGVKLDAACDTGAPCTLIPISFYKNKNIFKFLRPCKIPYVDYNGKRICVLGEYDASVSYRGVIKKLLLLFLIRIVPLYSVVLF